SVMMRIFPTGVSMRSMWSFCGLMGSPLKMTTLMYKQGFAKGALPRRNAKGATLLPFFPIVLEWYEGLAANPNRKRGTHRVRAAHASQYIVQSMRRFQVSSAVF